LARIHRLLTWPAALYIAGICYGMNTYKLTVIRVVWLFPYCRLLYIGGHEKPSGCLSPAWRSRRPVLVVIPYTRMCARLSLWHHPCHLLPPRQPLGIDRITMAAHCSKSLHRLAERGVHSAVLSGRSGGDCRRLHQNGEGVKHPGELSTQGVSRRVDRRRRRTRAAPVSHRFPGGPAARAVQPRPLVLQADVEHAQVSWRRGPPCRATGSPRAAGGSVSITA